MRNEVSMNKYDVFENNKKTATHFYGHCPGFVRLPAFKSIWFVQTVLLVSSLSTKHLDKREKKTKNVREPFRLEQKTRFFKLASSVFRVSSFRMA